MQPCWFDLKPQKANQAKWHPPHPKLDALGHRQIVRLVHANLQSTKPQVRSSPNVDHWQAMACLSVCCCQEQPNCYCPCLLARPHPRCLKIQVVDLHWLWFVEMSLFYKHPSFGRAQQYPLWSRAIHQDMGASASRGLRLSRFVPP